jgi:hypothetical protein
VRDVSRLLLSPSLTSLTWSYVSHLSLHLSPELTSLTWAYISHLSLHLSPELTSLTWAYIACLSLHLSPELTFLAWAYIACLSLHRSPELSSLAGAYITPWFMKSLGSNQWVIFERKTLFINIPIVKQCYELSVILDFWFTKQKDNSMTIHCLFLYWSEIQDDSHHMVILIYYRTYWKMQKLSFKFNMF